MHLRFSNCCLEEKSIQHQIMKRMVKMICESRKKGSVPVTKLHCGLRDIKTFFMDIDIAINGEFHRQIDVKATESMEKIVDYIAAHDRAKATIMNDYRKLPRSTKKQKRYYEAAKRKDKRNAVRRVDDIFAVLEQSQIELKRYSFCSTISKKYEERRYGTGTKRHKKSKVIHD